MLNRAVAVGDDDCMLVHRSSPRNGEPRRNGRRRIVMRGLNLYFQQRAMIASRSDAVVIGV
jgi:hypothetical protein